MTSDHGQTPDALGGEEPALDVLYESREPVIGKVPCARGTIFVGFKHAVESVWGAYGIAQVARALPPAVRSDTLENVVVNTQWLPETHVLAWYDALWNGPCEGRREKLALALDRMIDFGFGRVRRVFLSMAQPSTIFERAPTFWRYDHTHGSLSVSAGETMARVTLRDHPYTENSLSCMAVAEIYRYCCALTRVRNVTSSHYRESEGALVVRLRWEP
jgi:hypothetical protein